MHLEYNSQPISESGWYITNAELKKDIAIYIVWGGLFHVVFRHRFWKEEVIYEHHEWSCCRFTYSNLVTTSISSRFQVLLNFDKISQLPKILISRELYMKSITDSDGRCVQEPGTYSLRPDETRIQDIPRSWRIITSINPHHDSGSKDSPIPSDQAARDEISAEARWLNQCSARAAQNI